MVRLFPPSIHVLVQLCCTTLKHQISCSRIFLTIATEPHIMDGDTDFEGQQIAMPRGPHPGTSLSFITVLWVKSADNPRGRG
jgi:hypothetical protein